MKKLLNIGNSVFFVLTVFWLYFALYFLYQFLSIDFTNLNSFIATFLLYLTGFIFFIFHFKQKVFILLKKLVNIIYRYKIITFCILIIFQLFLTLTSLGLASADTSIIYNIATNHSFSMETDYLSFFPNNFFLIFWFKLNYLFFSNNTILALAIWNIIFIDSSIYFVAKTNELLYKKTSAKIAFVLMILIIGVSPQYIYTYSDSITLFLLSFAILMLSISLKINNIIYILFSGITFGIAFGFRPTVMIPIIAIALVFMIGVVQKKITKHLFIFSLIFVISFSGVVVSNKLLLNSQKIIKYEEQKNRTLLYFVNLGLTYSGNNHGEISNDVLESEGDNRNSEALKEINERLDNYKYESFIGHLYYKYYWMIGEGMFGWVQERVLSEKQLISNSLISKFQHSRIAALVRSYVYVDGVNYLLYPMFIQFVWIIITVGLIISTFNFKSSNFFLLSSELAIFGGLLFLFIFEAGRTRYLIQFLPFIITLSSSGIDYLITNWLNYSKKENISD